MDIGHYRQQHEQILEHVSELRGLIARGIGGNADAIVRTLVAMSTTIRQHLAWEDSVLYPALRASPSPQAAALGERFQSEMGGIARAYDGFIARWAVGARIASSPEAFREDANAVFKALHERLLREEQELYPVAMRTVEDTDGPG